MTITTPPTNAPATATAAPAQTPMAQLSSNFSTFLQLLTTQLKNQDPTAPMDSNQFTQQLVEFSQVEQQIDTNTNLKTLISQGTSNASTMASAYLGRKVSVTGGNASLSAGAANWTYNLATDAGSTALTISDARGKIVYTGAGEIAAGNHSFTWNGRDNNGNQLGDGTYTLAVNATTSGGEAVTSSVASAGTVTQIDMTGGSPKLVIGNMEIDLADVAAIAN
jgi:flagellar basal-body rod modification protein FlgD